MVAKWYSFFFSFLSFLCFENVCVFSVFCGDMDCGSSGYMRVYQGFSRDLVGLMWSEICKEVLNERHR